MGWTDGAAALPDELDFEARLAFRDFTLDMAASLPGAGISALFGPSGSGKSTLLRVIAGHQRADGHVRFGGETWADAGRFVPAHRRGVGMVAQDAGLFQHLSIAGNLRYAKKRARRPGPSEAEVVAALDLAPLLSRSPGTLSGGERRRAAIGRALLAAPRLLLLDEPLSGLDLPRKGEILGVIASLPARFSLPVIFVSHDVDEVAQLADTLLVVAAGRVVAEGPAPEVMGRLDLQPLIGRFEAGSLVEATIAGHDEQYRLTRLDLAGQPLTMPMIDLPVGHPVRLRLRARDVAIATERPAGISIRNALSACITGIAAEPETAFAEVTAEIAPGIALRARITRAAVAELGLARQQDVFMLVKSVALDRRLLPRPMDGGSLADTI